MTITDIDLPDEAIMAAMKTFWPNLPGGFLRNQPQAEAMSAAIRAALQALVNCGRMTQLTEEERTALHRHGLKWPKNIWLIRLDADERERALQEERK